MIKKVLYMLTMVSVVSFSEAKAADLTLPDFNNTNSTDLSLPKLDEIEKIKVTDIVVNGSERKESVLISILMRKGDYITSSQLKEELQRVYGLGYFKEDLTATKEPYLDGYRIVFNLSENPVVKSLVVSGSTIFQPKKLESIFDNQIGKVLNFNDAKESIETIRKMYSDLGYSSISINPQLNPSGDINLVINEGIIEAIRLKGNTETKPDVILRELRLKAGDILNNEILKDDVRRILNTNFFETPGNAQAGQSAPDPLRFYPGEKNKDHIIIEISVKEKSTGSVNLGAGYNTRDGIVGTFSISKSNVFGTGQNVAVDLQAGAGWLSATGANWLGKVDWYDPWFLPTLLPARTGVGFSIYRQRQGNFFQNINQFSSTFDTGNAFYNYIMINDRTGASFNFSRGIFGDPLTTPWRLAFSVRGEQISPSLPRVEDVQIKITKDSAGKDLVGKDNKPLPVDKNYDDLKNSKVQSEKDIADKITKEFKTYTDTNILKDLTVSKKGFDNRLALGLSLSYDTRDFVAKPRDGWNNSLSVEPSFGDVSYWKYFATINKYFAVPYFDAATFAIGGRLGSLVGDSARISIYERFYSGSFDTIRGWPEYGYMSGENVFVGSAELRFPIYNIVSGVAFVDVGNFWNQSWKVTKDNIKLDSKDGDDYNNKILNDFMHYGFGLGVRLDTPLGALRADYGIRDITRPFDLSKGAQFHFNIGQKF